MFIDKSFLAIFIGAILYGRLHKKRMEEKLWKERLMLHDIFATNIAKCQVKQLMK
jgi:hypothetical protein